MYRYHSVFVLDWSQSMQDRHCRPLQGTPVSHLISSQYDNCFGAVLSAMYGFLAARHVAVTKGGLARQDAYSIILFGDEARVRRFNYACAEFTN